MEPKSLVDMFTTPHLADACARLGVPMRCAPPGMRPAILGMRCSGRVLPARHVGSVDVFFEAFEQSAPGDVLVVDNAGRLDEACVGDLVAREARVAGLAGIIIWGLHRDTRDLADIAWPVFSLGALPAGPLRLDPRPPDALTSSTVGAHVVTADDLVVADSDGVLFLPAHRQAEILSVAAGIRETERKQALDLAAGRSLREQLRFRDFLSKRSRDPAYTLRQHLREIQGAIEE